MKNPSTVPHKKTPYASAYGVFQTVKKASQSLRPQAQIEYQSFSPATCASEKIPLGSQTPLFCLSAGNNVGLQIPLARVAVRNNGLPPHNTGIMLSERRPYHAQKSYTPLQGMRYACLLAVAEIAAFLLAELPQDHRKRRPHVAGLVPAGPHTSRRALSHVHARQRPVRGKHTERVNLCSKLCGKLRAGRRTTSLYGMLFPVVCADRISP